MSERRPAIVISGFYGFGNTGDEAILQATITGVRKHVPEARITVLSADPAVTSRMTGVAAVHRYRVRQVWSALERGGLLLSGGGGLFQDTTSRRSLIYYLAIVLLARLRGMKTLIYAQGLGPLQRTSSRAAVCFVLKRVDRITFRDPASASLLAQVGLSGRAIVTSDPAYTLDPAPLCRGREIMAGEGVPEGPPVLAVAVRPWPGVRENGLPILARALAESVDRSGAHLLFIPMYPSEDTEISRELAGLTGRPHTILQGAYSPAEIAAVIGSARAMVAMRLHALILGSLSGVPAVVLSYDPKIDAAAAQLNLPGPLDVRKLQHHTIATALDAALDASQTNRDEIRSSAVTQRSLAERNYEVVREHITTNQ